MGLVSTTHRNQFKTGKRKYCYLIYITDRLYQGYVHLKEARSVQLHDALQFDLLCIYFFNLVMCFNFWVMSIWIFNFSVQIAFGFFVYTFIHLSYITSQTQFPPLPLFSGPSPLSLHFPSSNLPLLPFTN